MDLRQIGYFVQVAELESFSKAAIALTVAQSALSRQVGQLERELGVRLLHRTGRGVTLTDTGRRALPGMKALLADSTRLVHDLKAEHGEPSGSVSLGVLTSVSEILLTPLLRRVHERYPRIKMQVREGLTDHVDEWVTSGKIDIGILYNSRQTPRAADEPLLKADLHLIGAAGDRLTAAKTVRLAQIAHLPMLLPSLPNRHRSLIARICAEHRIALNITFELDSIPTMKNLVASTNNYTLLPMHAVYREVTAGGLQAARIVSSSISRTVLLATTTHHPQSIAAREVMRLIRQLVAELVRSGQLPGRI